MVETIPIATDAITKLAQYGLAAVCIIQLGVLVYLIKVLTNIITKTNTIIANQIAASISAQQSLKDVVANNTEITKRSCEAIDKSSRMTCDSIAVLRDLQIAVASCPKK